MASFLDWQKYNSELRMKEVFEITKNAADNINEDVENEGSDFEREEN